MNKNRFCGKTWKELPILLDRCTDEQYDYYQRQLLKDRNLDELTDLQVYTQYLKDNDKFPEHPVFGKGKRTSIEKENNWARQEHAINDLVNKMAKQLLLNGFTDK